MIPVFLFLPVASSIGSVSAPGALALRRPRSALRRSFQVLSTSLSTGKRIGICDALTDTARNLPPLSLYYVEKMAFASLGGREKDKSTIHYNGYITIKSVPLEAYGYVVNGKSAIEWIMERYRITVDKDSGIKNDPNDWCREHDDPEYIFNLVQRVVRVSVETVRIVGEMPLLSYD